MTSEQTSEYNCIAWAVGESDRNWDPYPLAGDYWPDLIPRDHRVSSLAQALETVGFEICDDGMAEVGYEKVALYGEQDEFAHVARLLDDGRWTSKLGKWEDIAHELASLETNLHGPPATRYGQVSEFMRRSRS